MIIENQRERKTLEKGNRGKERVKKKEQPQQRYDHACRVRSRITSHPGETTHTHARTKAECEHRRIFQIESNTSHCHHTDRY